MCIGLERLECGWVHALGVVHHGAHEFGKGGLGVVAVWMFTFDWAGAAVFQKGKLTGLVLDCVFLIDV